MFFFFQLTPDESPKLTRSWLGWLRSSPPKPSNDGTPSNNETPLNVVTPSTDATLSSNATPSTDAILSDNETPLTEVATPTETASMDEVRIDSAMSTDDDDSTHTDYDVEEATESTFENVLSSTPENNQTEPFPKTNSGDESILIEDESDVLTMDEIKSLSLELPTRLLCCTWRKEFSSSRDGFSLGSLYRHLRGHEGLPSVLLIRDLNGQRFGSFVSEAFKVSEFTYGSGETFVFSVNPFLRVWKWSGGRNSLFVLCSNSAVCVGIDDGKFAIYLDADLNRGRSQSCETFGNELLTPTGDFQAAVVEVWTFDSS